MQSTILTLSSTTSQTLRNCHKNHCNGYPILNCKCLHNHWVTWYDQKTIRKPRLSTLLDPTYAKHYSHSVKHYIGYFKYLHIHNGSKTVAMDTLDYTGHISTTIGSNDMIKKPLRSQDQLLYLTSPTLSIILTPSSATSQPLQNCQTLQRFLSYCEYVNIWSVQCSAWQSGNNA